MSETEATQNATPGETPMEPVGEPVTEWERGAERDEQGRRLCGAKRRDGEPCRAPAMDGQRRCRNHGAATPAARRAARLRLTELVDPSIETLARLMATGSSDAIKLRAAEALLDRAGHPRASRVEASVSHVDARELLIDKLRTLRAQRGQIEHDH